MATRLVCSECNEGNYVQQQEIYNDAYAKCDKCGDERHIAWDIARHLDLGESITIEYGYVALVAADEEN